MRLIILILLTLPSRNFAEPFTIGVSLVVGAVASYFFYSDSSENLKDIIHIAACSTPGASYLGSKIECCGQPWIRADIKGLRKSLKSYLFGQHIVQEMVPSAISATWGPVKPSKPLVLSFHGWPGNGKNYVIKFIAEHYFLKGDKSRFFHLFSGRNDFGIENNVSYYQKQLAQWVRGNVSQCEYSMFIFDEVDKMPPNILDAIKPFLDHHNNFQGVDYRRAIFIFISNTGGDFITKKYLDLWRKKGISRDEMKLNNFDNVLNLAAFNDESGLKKSDLIDHHLIDHYIPFLPLEKSHVEKCIIAELRKHDIFKATPDVIEEIMEVITFEPQPEMLFSSTGCKRISQQVATIIEREKLKKQKF